CHALFNRSPAPAFKRLQGRLHCGLNVLFPGFLMDADYLRRARGIQRANLVRSFYPVSADDQIVLTPELAANPGQGLAHLAGRVPLGEIDCWLVAKLALASMSMRTDGSFESCHG